MMMRSWRISHGIKIRDAWIGIRLCPALEYKRPDWGGNEGGIKINIY